VTVLSANDIAMALFVFPTKWHVISGQNPVATVKRASLAVFDTMLNNFCAVEPVLYTLKVDEPVA